MNRTTLMQRDDAFIHEVLMARGKLEEIASGQTDRGRRVSQYDMEAGKRPLKPVEARALAQRTIERLNVAINKFQDSQPKPWEWDRFENRYD